MPAPLQNEVNSLASATRKSLSLLEGPDELDAALSEPTHRAIEAMARLDGDIIVLGAGGKMGPSLAAMARRASDVAGIKRRVIGVSRFTEPGGRQRLEASGVESIACNLLDPSQVDRLPTTENVVFMAGLKFGAASQSATTWAMNTYAPAIVASKFRHSRIAAFSTGNIYGLTPVARGGSQEEDSPLPVGEYAMSCLGRERILEHFSNANGVKLTLLRLNYACEFRYGVLVDLAEKVLGDEPIDLTMGYVNVIWQTDANAMALCSLEHSSSPPCVLNISGPEISSVRKVCEEFGRLLSREPRFIGREASDALLSDGTLAHNLLDSPRESVSNMIQGIAAWVQRGGDRWRKPTRFQVRDGSF